MLFKTITGMWKKVSFAEKILILKRNIKKIVTEAATQYKHYQRL